MCMDFLYICWVSFCKISFHGHGLPKPSYFSMLSSWTQLPVQSSPSRQTSEPNQEQVGALALALQASLAGLALALQACRRVCGHLWASLLQHSRVYLRRVLLHKPRAIRKCKLSWLVLRRSDWHHASLIKHADSEMRMFGTEPSDPVRIF
jgi:hypothetical protein